MASGPVPVYTQTNVSTPAFVLGSIVFSGTEVPEELNHLGGDQLVAVHEFPGGVRTLQSLGAFPPPDITWSGLLYGATAFSRSFAIDRLRVQGDTITLSYGGWAWSGVVRSYLATVVNEWLVRYTLSFIPAADLATPPVVPDVSSGADQFHAALAAIGGNIPTTLFGVTLPNAIAAPLQALYSTASGAINAAGGAISALGSADIGNIAALAGQVTTAGTAIMAAFDITQPEAAQSDAILSMLAYANVIQNLASGATNPSITIETINPNLYQLAAQYLGDASRWTEIATLNDLTDPMPLGQFTLNIPSAANVPPLPTAVFS